MPALLGVHHQPCALGHEDSTGAVRRWAAKAPLLAAEAREERAQVECIHAPTLRA